MKKRRILRLLILFCLFAAAFSGAVRAEKAGAPEEFYAEQYKNSGADGLDGALPDETREFLIKNGIDPSDYNWVNSLTAESVFGHIAEFVKSGAKVLEAF